MTTTLEANVTTNSEPMDEDINFVDDILDSTCEMEDVQSVQSLDSDDEFNVEVWSVSKAQNWPFRPLTESSWQEVGPLVQINSFAAYPKFVLGGMCTQGRAPTSKKIKGDGNCYFRAISFYLCGEEHYYSEVRKLSVTLFQHLMVI